ncbi:MAG: nucleoside kinase [Anaerolineae bacterium]|nr:nucleoside kinase [Anaerolineae bacterium]
MIPDIQHETSKSDTVQVFLANGEILRGKRGATLENFLTASSSWDEKDQYLGAIVNGKLRELTYPVEIEINVKPIRMSDRDGALIYRRSLTYILEAAFEELFPDDELIVDHSVPTGGYFCRVKNRNPLTSAELVQLQAVMQELVKKNLPFEKLQVSLEEAVRIFESKGFEEKVKLLKFRHKKHLVMYRLGNHMDYHHGYMVPSTGYLHTFGLQATANGFVLRYPRRNAPDRLQAMPETDKLVETFQLYSQWLSRLGIDCVGALNEAVEYGNIRELVLVTEALHEQKIAEIAGRIADQRDQINLVLIAGPSSSGKTTSSKRLTVQLIARGIVPYTLELDNYFVDRELTPRDENGEFDFEQLGALNIERLNADLRKMASGQRVQLPRFDFHTGKSVNGEEVRLRKNQVIIMEGIHGLNPGLLPSFPQEKLFRIYASCLTQLNLDRYNRISTTDTRLIRRIVRDARERGYSAQQTIGRWESVRRGEKRHIFPYQDNADEMLNTALVYELSALKPLAEPLLRQVDYQSEEYIEANRLLSMLEWFLPLNPELIPDNSILREFIGGSILRDFNVQHLQ